MKKLIRLILLMCVLLLSIQSESEEKMPYISQVKIGNTKYSIKDAGENDTVGYLNADGSGIVEWGNQSWTGQLGECTISTQQPGVIHVSGTCAQKFIRNLFDNSSSLPKGMTAGESYYFSLNTPNSGLSANDCAISIYYKSNESTSWTIFKTAYPNKDQIVTIPSNAIGLLIRCEIFVSERVWNDDLYLSLTKMPSLGYLRRNTVISNSNVLESCSLNSLYGSNSFYLLVDSRTYTDGPSDWDGVGFLQSQTVGIWTMQLLYSLNAGTIWKRRASGASNWSNWVAISGGETKHITNEYTTNHYSNTYNVTATPTITTDTNNYLAAPGDSRDMTSAIQTMLETTGVCNLGPGTFYVTGIDIPDNATLRGCGAKTIIRLADSVTDGYAVHLNKYGTVSDLYFVGANYPGGITPSAIVGTRHAVLFEGNYDGDRDQIPVRCTLSNLYIFGFAGGGITCNNTGYDYDKCLNVVNCYIFNCDAGINIAYWSEFNRFTNVSVHSCYYGCINNGGNNTFISCDFSGNRGIGVLMDNTNSQSPNNTHGSMIGCVINHTNNNTGIGIKMINCSNGYIFTGCQLFYSQIYIEDCSGINISDTNFGLNNCDITISGGGLIVFANNIHQARPTITITNNQHVHFDNCYSRTDGSAITQ